MVAENSCRCLLPLSLSEQSLLLLLAALYLVWYLAENRGRVKAIKELTDERAF